MQYSFREQLYKTVTVNYETFVEYENIKKVEERMGCHITLCLKVMMNKNNKFYETGVNNKKIKKIHS